MAPFTAPTSVPGPYNNQWRNTAPHDICDPEVLWGRYWNRFNTFQIPISDANEYFNTAMAVAKASRDKQDFERKFDQINMQRQKHLLALMSGMLSISANHGDRFPCKVAQVIALKACMTGSLGHFVQLLRGTVSGWAASTAGSHADNNRSENTKNPDGEEPKDHFEETQNASDEGVENTKSPINEETKDVENTKSPIEEGTRNPAEGDTKDNVEETQSLAPEETQTPITKESEDEMEETPYSFNPDDEEYSTQQVPSDWEPEWFNTDSDNESKPTEEPDHEGLKDDDKSTGTNAEYTASKSNSTARETLDSDNNQPPSASILHKEDKNSGTQEAPENPLSNPSDGKRSTSTKKRVRFLDDDDDDADAIQHEPKRQKMENSAAPTPTNQHSPSTQ